MMAICLRAASEKRSSGRESFYRFMQIFVLPIQRHSSAPMTFGNGAQSTLLSPIRVILAPDASMLLCSAVFSSSSLRVA
jgi:hypothetical protein